jgi:hypothetical protein
MNKTVRPGFFVVGAPKCGTTSLYAYLKQHPQIYLPRIKELNFFCTDLHFRYPLLNEEQFLSYYSDYENERAVGEVSVWNLFSSSAPANIHQFNPSAKIIIMLRKPADMLYALHSNHVFNDNEQIHDFKAALLAQADRKKGLQIAPLIKCPVEGLYYYDVAAYGKQVQRYLELFGTEKVKVILFDDFIHDTKATYQEVLTFLEVDEFLPETFVIHNANKSARSSFVKRMTIQTPHWIKATGKWFFPHQTKRRDLLMYWLWKLNSKPVNRPPLSKAIHDEVTEVMKVEMFLLQQLIGRDLTHWQ